MRKKHLLMSVLVLVFCTKCHKPNSSFMDNDANFDPRLTGGQATTFEWGAGAFGVSIEGLNTRNQFVHALGDKVFEQSFVAAPALLFQGLGPAYNNTSCGSCHHNDGVGTPTLGLPSSSLLMRISIPGVNPHGGTVAAPGFGDQLQNLGILGTKPEVEINISYQNTVYIFPDGSKEIIHTPTYTLINPYTPLPANYMLSPRLAPPVFGLGLLELIPASTIEALADPYDVDKDGIKGHPNYVYNSVRQITELGRFGLKANTATLQLQVANAFQQDMGITSYIQPQESVWGQIQSQILGSTPSIDIADTLLDAVTFYIRTLAVPARRNVQDASSKNGEILFKQLNCSKCHIPTLYTGTNITLPSLSNQRIHPYTDLLLHDMGAGLADNRPDFHATGTEWRTKPLWGIGLLPIVNGKAYYLHDGRATTITEAILWHDGEAAQSKNDFSKLDKKSREDLITFISSL